MGAALCSLRIRHMDRHDEADSHFSQLFKCAKKAYIPLLCN